MRAHGMKKKKLLLVKALAQLPPEARTLAAHYGVEHDRDATAFVMIWSVFATCTDPKKFAEEVRSNKGGLMQLFSSHLEPKITDAVRRRDGTFLRHLADAIERHDKPLDAARYRIGLMALCQQAGREVEGGWDLTANEWCAMISKQIGKPIDIVLFRRWAKEMGLKFLPDKKGRKPST